MIHLVTLSISSFGSLFYFYQSNSFKFFGSLCRSLLFSSIDPSTHLARYNRASLSHRNLFLLGIQSRQRVFAVYTERYRNPIAVGKKHWSPYSSLMLLASLLRGMFLYCLQFLFFWCFYFSENSSVFFLSAWFLSVVVFIAWFSLVELSFKTFIFYFSKGFIVKRNCVKAQFWIFWFVWFDLWKVLFWKRIFVASLKSVGLSSFMSFMFHNYIWKYKTKLAILSCLCLEKVYSLLAWVI